MRARLLAFGQALRQGGVAISVAESMDAARAVGAAGVEREVLREALAATLVKDERDRATFDRLFELHFPLGGGGDEAGGRRRRRGEGGAGPPRGAGAGAGRGRTRDDPRDQPDGPGRATPATTGHVVPGEGRASGARPAGRDARARELLHTPFRDLTAGDFVEARDLARVLGQRLRARLARRERRRRRGRLDLRRTIRAATATGGVPARLRYRARRPGRPDLVTLCDLSGSVAAASELLLGLLAPLGDQFRRVASFGYVDRLCPITLEGGHVAPAGPLDLYARSDLGHVLVELDRTGRGALTGTTLLLVLGDARNNRLPPRADVLRALAGRAQRVVWLVPEPTARWNTGDSALARYAPSCEAVVECVDLAGLAAAVRRAL